MNENIQIGIAEDHDLVREGLVHMLGDYSNIEVLFEASNGKELLTSLEEFSPDIILLDIAMPILGGMTTMQKIKKQFPKIKIIVISALSEDEMIKEYVKLGASSFLPKNCKKITLIAAIYDVFEKGYYFEDNVAMLLAENTPPPPKIRKREKLTERDIEFINLISQNKTHEEIASKMGIKLGTINWYKHKLLVKTDSKDITGLLDYAKIHNII